MSYRPLAGRRAPALLHSERATTHTPLRARSCRDPFRLLETPAASTRNAQRYGSHASAGSALHRHNNARIRATARPQTLAPHARGAGGRRPRGALARASKPLLRVGANGVKESHRNSLVELLEAHPYVCVKVNGAKDAAAVAAAADALAGDGRGRAAHEEQLGALRQAGAVVERAENKDVASGPGRYR